MPLRDFSELDEFEIDPASVQRLDESWCREREVVVLDVVDPDDHAVVTLGMVHPKRRNLVREVEAQLGRRVRPVRLNAFEVGRALDIGWGLPDPARERHVLELRPIRTLSHRADVGAPRMLDEILALAIQQEASDVHIEVYGHDVDVRYRLDGVLRQVPTPLSVDNVREIVARIKVLADLDIAEQRRAQDGRLRAIWRDDDGRYGPRGERPIDFRVSVLPGPAGEDVVLRLLDRTRGVLTLDQLGLLDHELDVYQQLIANPEGLVLVTGPTGSGKTTTLYSSIDRVNTPKNKILTAENPIEYRFPKTNQKQVSPWMSFADYARAFLRQNPDIILIGEIRDGETTTAALKAAQTGHLVLSTLHAGDAVRTVARLRSLGGDPGVVASCLLGALSQRLVRRVCPHCREDVRPTDDEARRLGLDPDETFARGPGCDACDGFGLRGRTGIYELFVVDGEAADLVAQGAPSHRLRRHAVERGMRSLVDDALAKARAGVVPLAEILRVIPYRQLQEHRLEGGGTGR